MDVEPVVFLSRQRQQRLAERALDRSQLLLARLLFLGAALLFDGVDELSLKWLQHFAQRRIRRVADEARTRARREVDERRIDVALQAAKVHGGRARSSSRARSSITRVPRRNNATRLLSDGSPRYSSAYTSPIPVRSAGS